MGLGGEWLFYRGWFHRSVNSRHGIWVYGGTRDIRRVLSDCTFGNDHLDCPLHTITHNGPFRLAKRAVVRIRRHWGSPQVDVSLSVSALQRRRARAGLIWATVSGPNRLPRRETISRHPLALTFFFSICVGLKTIVSPQVLPYT